MFTFMIPWDNLKSTADSLLMCVNIILYFFFVEHSHLIPFRNVIGCLILRRIMLTTVVMVIRFVIRN